jgi:hypothetical protein
VLKGGSVIQSALTALCKQVSGQIFKDYFFHLGYLLYLKKACYPFLYTKTIKWNGKYSSGVQNKYVPAIFGDVLKSRKMH